MSLKKLLPFENYVLTTALSPDEVSRCLSENTQPKKAFRFFGFNRPPSKPYEGEISENSFCISRIISYRNSFLPIIRGEISSNAGQTQIQVKMRLANSVVIFISFWLGIVGLACIGILLFGVLQIRKILQAGFSPMLLIPFGMFIFGYLLTSVAFKVESRVSKKFLATTLHGQEN